MIKLPADRGRTQEVLDHILVSIENLLPSWNAALHSGLDINGKAITGTKSSKPKETQGYLFIYLSS